MGRRPIGRQAMTEAQRSKRYRIRYKRTHPSALTLRKQAQRDEREAKLGARAVEGEPIAGGRLYHISPKTRITGFSGFMFGAPGPPGSAGDVADPAGFRPVERLPLHQPM
jgi:hypothetical protein